MANTTLKEHLLLCVQRLKTYTNEQVLELNKAVIGALEDIITVLEGKADTDSMTTALAKKADVSDVSGVLAFFNASNLYIDADGDIAQRD